MGMATDIVEWGTGIFTAIAAGAAWKSAKVSSKQFTDQKNDQMKVERPRLVPLNKFVSPHPKEILSDWKTSTEIDYIFTDFQTNFSNVKIPIINTGKSFASGIASRAVQRLSSVPIPSALLFGRVACPSLDQQAPYLSLHRVIHPSDMIELHLVRR